MSKPIFRFMEFELITARREIRKNGEAKGVEPKVYDLLLYLLERRDRSVGKEELQDAIWPNVIVTEAALTRCIMKARQIIGDSSKEQLAIKTIHSHGYRFVAEVTVVERESAFRHSTGAGGEMDRTSIAVLPFVNLSGDDEQEYLVDGLTQDIITDLSRNSWLFVIARSSSLYYKGKNVDYQDISSELGAQYIVEGSLRRDKEKIRISASLTDAVTGVREWSERYDQPITDLFEIQDEISRGIAASLGSQVRRAEGRRAERADPGMLDAWGLVHRGMAISWSKFNRESNVLAENLYRQALELSPGNARAMAFLATSVAMKVANGWSDAIADDSAEAWELGGKAVDRMPEDPMVLASYGHLNTCLGKAKAAVGILERAIELDPSSSWGHGLLAFAMTGAGRAGEAIPILGKALRLSPRDAARHWHLSMLSWAYLQLGQFEDAARESQRAINAFSGWQVPWATLAVARAGLGQWEDAKEAAEVAAKLEPRVTGEGFGRFFKFVVRDEEAAAHIRGWLENIWPKTDDESGAS